MIFAIDDFAYIKNELSEFKLKLLLNIEDLNNSIFDEVFNSLKPHQQEQYLVYKESEKAKMYREERNATLPYVDFNNLPETFDDDLLQKIMLYQKDGEVRDAVFDSLSDEHQLQITQLEWKMRDEKEAKRRASLTEDERKKEDEALERRLNNPEEFYGNIGEPDTVTSYILKYGVNPLTHEPETIESFYEKYTIDPKTGDPIPKEKQ
jgi:DNA polymerase III delta prime subunit